MKHAETDRKLKNTAGQTKQLINTKYNRNKHRKVWVSLIAIIFSARFPVPDELGSRSLLRVGGKSKYKESIQTPA